MRAALCVAVLFLQVACSTPGPGRPALGKADLLTPPSNSDAVLAAPPISAEQAFGLGVDMLSFLDELRAYRDPPARSLERLLAAMTQDGLLSLDYNELSTQTVSETFRARQGNCLSFTMLFVTLARELGLDVRYQLMRARPTWSNDKGLVVIGNHVNALVWNAGGRDYVVDFNFVDYDAGRYSARVARDSQILALFYANRGVEAMLENDYDLAFRYLKAAIETDPRVIGGWSNLGALYARQNRYEHAESAYLHALENDPRDLSALSNLASLYAATGRQALTDRYHERVRRYQQRNPYYHYALAQGAHQQQRFEDALQALASAIRLQKEPEFFALRTQVYAELGEQLEAQQNIPGVEVATSAASVNLEQTQAAE